MGKLIKTQFARLMMAAALLDVFWSAIWGYPYPASLLDATAQGLPYVDVPVSPVPILQIVNTIIGGLGCINEFSKPVNRFLAHHHIRIFQAIPLRCVIYCLALGPIIVQFQTSQAAPYVLIGTTMYIWGFIEGERLDENGVGKLATPGSRFTIV